MSSWRGTYKSTGTTLGLFEQGYVTTCALDRNWFGTLTIISRDCLNQRTHYFRSCSQSIVFCS